MPIRLLEGAAYLCSTGVTRIDLLKVDTQGSETRVLQGLLPLLGGHSGLRVLLELTPFSLRLAGSSGSELLALLEPLGLPVAIVDHIEHRLVASDYAALSEWCNNVDATAGDRGFMNIFLGTPPPDLQT